MRLSKLVICRMVFLTAVSLAGLSLGSCAMVDVPSARNTSVPTPTSARPRTRAVNEVPDSVMYLPLGDDILVPEIAQDDPLPYEMVGPFELRNETLAGALQLILADYDIGLAFETNAAMEQRITVANLRGELGKVIRRVCSLANLYCSHEDGTLIVKELQAFTVTLPPIGASANTNSESGSGGNNPDYLTNVAAGLAAIIGASPIVDTATRTIVYTASQRTATLAERYFQRLRANTAMVVYETYIWEVQLTAGNSAGIDWSMLDSIGKYNVSAALAGSVAGDFTNPISIGLPTTSSASPTDFLEFLSQFGAVKTISQPQITVLSGASAQMRVADTRNYVSELTSTMSDTQTSVSVSTDTVDSGFTLTIGSSWDKATVYTSVNVEITDVLSIDDFSVTGSGDDAETTRIQLPQTTERELSTQIRVRPGDSVLIGGLVRERDNFDKAGIGFMEPIVPQSRTAQTQNLELVIMLRPRVVVYTDPGDLRYQGQMEKRNAAAISAAPTNNPASYLSARPDVSSYQVRPSETVTAPAPVAPRIPEPIVPAYEPAVSVQPLPAPVDVPAPVPAARITPPQQPMPQPVSVMPPAQPLPVATDPVGQVSSAPPPRISDMSPRRSASVSPAVEPPLAPAPVNEYTPPVRTPEPAMRSEYVSPYETYDYYSPNR